MITEVEEERYEPGNPGGECKAASQQVRPPNAWSSKARWEYLERVKKGRLLASPRAGWVLESMIL